MEQPANACCIFLVKCLGLNKWDVGVVPIRAAQQHNTPQHSVTGATWSSLVYLHPAECHFRTGTVRTLYFRGRRLLLR